jgi:hypothetical protein
MTRTLPLDVRCPACAQPPGQPCLDVVRGVVLRRAHGLRRDAARAHTYRVTKPLAVRVPTVTVPVDHARGVRAGQARAWCKTAGQRLVAFLVILMPGPAPVQLFPPTRSKLTQSNDS